MKSSREISNNVREFKRFAFDFHQRSCYNPGACEAPMLIKDDEANKRLNNPLNLINQLRNGSLTNSKRSEAMRLFTGAKKEAKPELSVVTFNPFQATLEEANEITDEPKASDLVESLDDKVKLALAHDEALGLLNETISILRSKVDEVRPDKLPAVIGAASKVVESIRKERAEKNKQNKVQDVHYHFYTPVQNKIETYETIEVTS